MRWHEKPPSAVKEEKAPTRNDNNFLHLPVPVLLRESMIYRAPRLHTIPHATPSGYQR
jgi:hypothetical protein